MLLFVVLRIGGFFGTEVGFGQTADLLGYVHVRGGDTLVVGGTPVRLKGLHCPEFGEAGGVQASSVISPHGDRPAGFVRAYR